MDEATSPPRERLSKAFVSLREAAVTLLAAIATLLAVLRIYPEASAGVLAVVLSISLARSHLDHGMRERLEAVLALPLVAALFKYGRFGEHDAWMVQQALVAYSVGLIGMILVKILAPGFYARQDISTPVRIGIATLVATQLMNLAFIVPLRHAGLALAIGILVIVAVAVDQWIRKVRK